VAEENKARADVAAGGGRARVVGGAAGSEGRGARPRPTASASDRRFVTVPPPEQSTNRHNRHDCAVAPLRFRTMRHTVRLRNSAGYFATLKPVGRSVRVYWSTRVNDPARRSRSVWPTAQRPTKRDHERHFSQR
jgi:hypothetical protein